MFLFMFDTRAAVHWPSAHSLHLQPDYSASNPEKQKPKCSDLCCVILTSEIFISSWNGSITSLTPCARSCLWLPFPSVFIQGPAQTPPSGGSHKPRHTFLFDHGQRHSDIRQTNIPLTLWMISAEWMYCIEIEENTCIRLNTISLNVYWLYATCHVRGSAV